MGVMEAQAADGAPSGLASVTDDDSETARATARKADGSFNIA